MNKKGIVVGVLFFVIVMSFVYYQLSKPSLSKVNEFSEWKLKNEYAQEFTDTEVVKVNQHINQLKNFYAYVVAYDNFKIYNENKLEDVDKNIIEFDEDWTINIANSNYMNNTFENEKIKQLTALLMNGALQSQLYISECTTIPNEKPSEVDKRLYEKDIKKIMDKLTEYITTAESQ